MSSDKKIPSTNVKLGTTVVTQDGAKVKQLVRFSHLHVHRWRLNQQSKKEEASVQLLIPKDNTNDKDLLDQAVAEQLAHYKAIDGEPGPDFHWPVVDGDTRKDSKGRSKPIPGYWVVSAKAYRFAPDGTENSLPECIGIERDAKNKLIPLTERQVKSGDWGRASINFKFFTQGKGGVGVYLNNVQRVREGEALSNRQSASDEYADYDDDDEAVDPLA